MEGVLRTLNLEGNISRYVQCFQIAGTFLARRCFLVKNSLFAQLGPRVGRCPHWRPPVFL